MVYSLGAQNQQVSHYKMAWKKTVKSLGRKNFITYTPGGIERR